MSPALKYVIMPHPTKEVYMWFKNILAYRVLSPFEYNAEELHELLADLPSRPCGQLEHLTIGWAPPMGVGHDNIFECWTHFCLFLMHFKFSNKMVLTAE